MKKLIILIFFTVFLISCNSNNQESGTGSTDENNTGTTLPVNNENTMGIQTQGLQDGDIVAVMKTTNGTIKLKLFTDLVPNTTTNFIGLAKKGYYNNVTFHRVIKDFMIQGGDPEGTGMGGESVYGKAFDDEFSPELTNIKYSISMANSGKNTNGSQFFINQANNNFLDNKHSVFGQVVEGTGTVDTIAKVKTGKDDKPEKDVKIISIDIMQYNNGSLKDYAFDLDTKLKEIEAANKQKAEAKKTKAIEAGDTVGVHYTGTYDNGEKFDTSIGKAPISFQVGAQQMIKGFDEGVVGMKIGEKKTLKLAPADAYGEKEIKVPKTDLKSFTDAGVKLEAGGVLPTSQGEIKILKADNDSITIENNHPMAGKTLNFDIEIMEIK